MKIFNTELTVAPESAFISCFAKLCLKSFLTVILEGITFTSQSYIHFQIEEGFYIALSESVQFVRIIYRNLLRWIMIRYNYFLLRLLLFSSQDRSDKQTVHIQTKLYWRRNHAISGISQSGIMNIESRSKIIYAIEIYSTCTSIINSHWAIRILIMFYHKLSNQVLFIWFSLTLSA